MKKGKTDKQLNLDKLRGRYQQLKKKKAKSNAAVREIMRLKALMAYYEGMKPETVAKCYGVGDKTFKQWIKKFEAETKVSDTPQGVLPNCPQSNKRR